MGQHSKSINTIQHTNRLRKKNHIIFSIDAEKVADKLLHPFLIKVLSKLGTEGNCLNLIKENYKTSTGNIRLNDERPDIFTLRLEQFLSIWLRDFTFTFHFHALEKEMATHSSVLAWRIPGTGKPGGLLSTGSHRVGQDWSDLAYLKKIHLRKFTAFF